MHQKTATPHCSSLFTNAKAEGFSARNETKASIVEGNGASKSLV